MKCIRFFPYFAVLAVLFQLSLARAEDKYSYKKETIFPAKTFWNEAAVKSYRDTRLAITKKEPVKTNVVLNTVDAAKTSLRGDGDVACQKKAEDMAKAFGISVILKAAKCSESDTVLNLGKKGVSQYDASIQDSPDKSMVFDLRDGRSGAQSVSVDWDHGFFQMKYGDSDYSFRYEDGKVIGIAEVTRFRMLQATEDKDGKLTADARSIANAKKLMAETQKNGLKRKALAVEPASTAGSAKPPSALSVQCMAEPKPKYNIPASEKDPNSRSLVKDAPDVYYRHKIPTPTYSERSNPTCGYEATPLLKGNKDYAKLEAVGNRLAKAFEYMRNVNFCSDSCAPHMVKYLSSINPSGAPTPVKIEKLYIPGKTDN